ncbi:SDR family NAD(P)-dependent oxidoreductase [Novosphingobium sp. SG720]|uniref:SDR family NAD(P)-dependent oxidoreductase n=1 Tax=Novosphingobium sp. SG720 TaxID=2586998 RepID=UPI0014456BE6|nr:SDR family NAD(P)-dependent oxidoreductase [Novosphingobium sp. SG720]NKJ44404.1 NAD(P)-dependent dehydrogenase (short-subunit alcohol dehydrogenase family) [Novosphingobium sp. SG720]
MATVIVAGGATGIGRASALGFRARGDDVLLIDHREEAAQVAAEDLPGRCLFMAADLADPEVPARAVALAVETFGGLDSVLVTAAVMQSAALAEWTPQMWAQSVNLNLAMPFFLAQAAAPHLRRSENPSIVLISSTGALRGHAGMSAYQATKAALPGLARSLTAELGPDGIRINCILPGWIETPFNDPFWQYQPDPAERRRAIEAQIPLRRQGEPLDVASMVLFMCSPQGRYIAGTSIVIDGGYTAV